MPNAIELIIPLVQAAILFTGVWVVRTLWKEVRKTFGDGKLGILANSIDNLRGEIKTLSINLESHANDPDAHRGRGQQ